MARAEPGEPFSLLGPLGNTWHAPAPERRPLLVAGGVGVAPLLFLARELVARACGRYACTAGAALATCRSTTNWRKPAIRHH